MTMDRRKFLGVTALGGGAFGAAALPVSASVGAGEDNPALQERPGRPSRGDGKARRDTEMARSKTYRPDPRLDLVLERVIDVPPERVWAAWTQPDRLKQWFAPAPWTTVDC